MAELRVSETIEEGGTLALEVDGQHVMVCKVAGKYHATSNICSHARVLLPAGRLRGTTITCPLHGARFDVVSGKCLGGPAFQDIASYPVTEDGNALIIATD